MPSERGRGSVAVTHGTVSGYSGRHQCRCPECRAARMQYDRRYHTLLKAQKKEPVREPLANIVLMPGAPTAQCPACTARGAARGWRHWPAIERVGRRWLFGCERGHRWFADVAGGRPLMRWRLTTVSIGDVPLRAMWCPVHVGAGEHRGPRERCKACRVADAERSWDKSRPVLVPTEQRRGVA